MDKNKKNNERYYWLKLDRHFFKDARIKKLRRLAGGDTYTIIYLKMMLLSIEFGGVIIYEGIEDNIADEISLKIDEDPVNVGVAINFLTTQNLMIELESGDYELIQAKKSIGSETYSNVYKRNKRLEKFQVDSKSIPIDIDIGKDIEKDILLPHTCVREDDEDELSNPTLDQVIKFVKDNNFKVNANKFFNHYNSSNWMIGNKPIKNWQSVLRAWELNAKETTTTSSTSKKPDWLIKYEEEFESTVECL